MPTPATDPRDLTTVAAVKLLLGITSSTDDQIIQDCITDASCYWLWRCSRDSLNTIADFNEWYDGNGSPRMFVRNTPITTVTLLAIDGRSIPSSADHIAAGYVIDQSAKSLALIGQVAGVYSRGTYGNPVYRGGCGGFSRGIQNINVQYAAGYDGAPPDIEMACRRQVATNYKRTEYRDMRSKVLGPAQTLNYRDWELAPEIERVIQNYSRNAIV